MQCRYFFLTMCVLILPMTVWSASRDASHLVLRTSRRQGNVSAILDVAPTGKVVAFLCATKPQESRKGWVYQAGSRRFLPYPAKNLGARSNSRLFSRDGSKVLSCDGKQIDWLDLQSGKRQVIVRRKRGESLRLYTLSPDRRWLAYAREKGMRTEFDYGTIALHVVRADGRKDQRLHVFEDCHTGSLTIDGDWWSPDGRRIAVDVIEGDDGGRTLLVDVRQGQVTKLGDYCACSDYVFDWSWSPDSKGKLKVSEQVKTVSISQQGDVRGEELLRSSNGKHFAFVSGWWLAKGTPSQSVLWLFSTQTGRKQLISRNCPSALWSEDGKRLYFARGCEVRVLKVGEAMNSS